MSNETLIAGCSVNIIKLIYTDISVYGGDINQKKWWLNIYINECKYEEMHKSIRDRVMSIWNIHPDKPKGYKIRWSGLNEIEISRVNCKL